MGRDVPILLRLIGGLLGKRAELERDLEQDIPPLPEMGSSLLHDSDITRSNSMAKLDDILQGILRDVDGALGCAVVDVSNGLLLGVAHTVPYFTQSYLEAVAAAAVDMVRGKNVLAVESLLSSQRGRKVENSIKEIQMTTDGTYHFMAVVPDKPNSMVVLITNKKTNLGMGWSAVRINLPRIAPLCPG
jgi:hypothetical protein